VPSYPTRAPEIVIERRVSTKRRLGYFLRSFAIPVEFRTFADDKERVLVEE
jgi:hypothetical protein